MDRASTPSPPHPVACAANAIEFAPPARRRIYLMRHGSVDYFDANGRPHDADAAELNEAGRAQARAAGSLLARDAPQIDKVIVSGLPRTVQTAQLVLESLGQPDRSLEVWPELQEIRGGELGTLRDDELREAFVGALEGIPSEDRRFMGGETIGSLLDRVLPAIDRLRSDRDWDTALLVLHGAVNRAILSYALTGRRMLLGGLLQSPACLNALDVGEGPTDWIVRYTNLFAADPVQRDARHSTMEQLLAQYLKSRRGADAG